MSQREQIEVLKKSITAVYFLEGKRLLTYSNINKLTAVFELEKFQRMHGKGITMLILNNLPSEEISCDIKDYAKYLEILGHVRPIEEVLEVKQ